VGVRTRTFLLLLTTALCCGRRCSLGGHPAWGLGFSNQIDEHDVAADASRVASQIDHGAEQLTLVTADWAHWDDTYGFMRESRFRRTSEPTSRTRHCLRWMSTSWSSPTLPAGSSTPRRSIRSHATPVPPADWASSYLHADPRSALQEHVRLADRRLESEVGSAPAGHATHLLE